MLLRLFYRNIKDAISSDKDCIEDLRVYPTRGCQEVIDRAVSVKAGCAELLYAYIDVEPVTFNRGFYTVDVRYFYRITADAFVGAARPVEITGLAVFDKRVILFGSEGSAKVFTSTGKNCGSDIQGLPATTAPTAVVESVDPIILGMKLVEVCQCRHNDNCCEIPPAVCACFPEELVTGGDVHRLFVTLGQFSIIRLERDTQLLMPAYDYCMPEKDCDCGCDCRQEDPCELFRKVQFPVGEFFPPNHCPAPKSVEYQDVRGCC
ncbi:hypothetical protein [Flintibacter porci]|uniref:hypothetical protein n=1 Tax=Flintibacter porci TaxID=3342383 RepID=UPI003F8A6E7F